MQYSEIIGIHKHFKSAFDIMSDIGDSWKTFISNDKFENNLNQIVNVFTSSIPNNRNSVWIQGTYGTGKSHSLAVLKHLLCDEYSEIEDYLPKINKAQVRNSISSFRQEKRVYPVIMKGVYAISDVADLTYTIQQEVANALKRDGIDISTKTDFESIKQIIENETMESFFRKLIENDIELHSYVADVSGLIEAMDRQDIKILRTIINGLKDAGLVGYRTHNIIEWLKEIKEELYTRGIADYLMIFWDEFTSLLNMPFRRELLNVIQDIAELSKTQVPNSDDTVGVYVMLVTHKRLDATETFKELKEDERNMAKARFIELDYDMQPTTTYHILSGALLRKNQEKLEELIGINVVSKGLVKDLVERIAEETSTNATEIKEKLVNLYPFHPYTSYLATFVSRVIGEAERSIFGFLNDDKSGFLKFIKNDIEATKFLTADCVWDFFLKAFETKSIGQFDNIINKYKLYGDTVNERGERYLEIFKVILLLNILYRVTTTGGDDAESYMVKPSTENVRAAFSGAYDSNQIDEVLDYLDDNQIMHRNPDGIFEIVSSTLPAKRLQEEKKKLYPVKEDVSKIIEGYNISCAGKLASCIGGGISRIKETHVFWGGEKEYTLRNKINSKFVVDYALHIALFFYRGETKELDTILNRKEVLQSESKKMLIQMSQEDAFRNVIFISVNTELGNKKFEAYLDSMAQEAVARSLNREEERQDGANTAEKWIKKWVTEIIDTGYADLIFRGEDVHLPFAKCNAYIQERYVNVIFRYGLDYLNVSNTAWIKQNSKKSVEKVLYALNRTALEHETSGADGAIRYLLSDGSNLIFDESLNLIYKNEGNPIVKVCNEVSAKLEKLKNEPSINLGKEFEYLTRPEYGYYQNRIFMAALALAFRPFIGKLYKSGSGQKINNIVMKDIIVALFDLWENQKFKDDLLVRMSTEEEQRLTEALGSIFQLHNQDGLIKTKWAIREQFELKNKAPLWALKYIKETTESYNDFIDKLFKFSTSADENIQQQFITELLDGIKRFNIELSESLYSVESEKCLDNYIEKELFLIGEKEECVKDVRLYLPSVLSGNVVYWEEKDVHENVLKWKIKKVNEEKVILNSCEGKEEAKRNENNAGVENNIEMDLHNRVVDKLHRCKYSADKLYEVLTLLIERNEEILLELDRLL